MRFLCGVCGKEFDTSSRRKQHEKDTHSVERGKQNRGVIGAWRRNETLVAAIRARG